MSIFPVTKPVTEKDVEKYGEEFLSRAKKMDYVKRDTTYYVPCCVWKSRVIKANTPAKLFELFVFVKKHNENMEIERKFGI